MSATRTDIVASRPSQRENGGKMVSDTFSPPLSELSTDVLKRDIEINEALK
jgi:hypothetical protein